MTAATDGHAIPPIRDLPAGRLADRARHLQAELRPRPGNRLVLPALLRPRLRTAALAMAGVCAAVAATLAFTLGGGSGGSHPAYVLETAHGDGWVGVAFTALTRLPAQHTPASSPTTTVIRGGTDGQRQLLHSIVRATRPNTITTIAVISAGTRVTLRMKAADNSLQTQWQEWLVAGAFRDRATAAGKHCTVALDNGDQLGTIARGTTPAVPPARPGDVRAARQRFERAAAKAGLRLHRLDLSRPDGVAVAATFETSHPALVLRHQMRTFLAAIGYGWHGYDGVYVDLIDRSGATVWQTATALRTTTGSVGSREDLAGCSPVASVGGYPGPPPCPVN